MAAKTYTEGAAPPEPGTAVNEQGSNTKTKLPPGGAWEMVEPGEANDTPLRKQEAGPEVVRANVHDILTGMY